MSDTVVIDTNVLLVANGAGRGRYPCCFVGSIATAPGLR